jgi:hypothetical protein
MTHNPTATAEKSKGYNHGRFGVACLREQTSVATCRQAGPTPPYGKVKLGRSSCAERDLSGGWKVEVEAELVCLFVIM